jgi:uncharacterized protein containing predicted cell adhesion domain and chW-repeats
MKKKIIPFAVLLAALTTGIVGCGEINSSNPQPTTSSEATSTTSSEKEVVHVSSISIIAEKTELFIGENTKVKTSVLPETADDKTFTLKSEDESILTVDQTGKVTAIAAGTTNVVATSTDGAKTSKVSITVKAASKPVLKMPEVLTYQASVGTAFTLPTVTAKDYKGNDITSSIEIEDLNEKGSIKNGVFTAAIAGEHTLSYYVEDPNDANLFTEGEIKINVAAAHEETFDVTGYDDPSALANYGTFKENFGKGIKSPTYRAIADSNNATHLSGGEDAINGNSLIVDANKTAGSAARCIFFNQFNDYFKRGISATYTVSFSYKILSNDVGNFSNFYLQLNWDGSSGLNQTFVPSNAQVNTVYEASFSFPGTKIPTTGNAWFGLFKLSGSNTDTIIAIDNLTFSAKEVAQVNAVVPSSEQLTNGFTFDMENNGTESTNGETVIIDKIENTDAKTAMKANDNFGKNALKLTNADDHLFAGLTKNNMVVGKKLTIEVYYYSVNNKGLHYIMMGDNGNPTLQIEDKEVSGNIRVTKYEGVIESGWNQLNIYGQGNSSFEIYIGKINLKLAEADPVPEDETPKGYKVGFNFNQKTRAFGTANETSRAVENFDNNAAVIANSNMGDAPQKVTFKNANTTIEWFRGDGRIEDKQKYKITLDYYVSNWSGRLMYNFDNNVFLEIGSNMEEGYHRSEITWTANRQVDFFSFYTPGDGGTGTFYVGNINVELIEIAK